ncbi:MAG: hypothetical protein AB1629_01695 [Candidatus Omnitrophota bacterium]
MKCFFHLDRESARVCNHCGKNICSECSVELKGEIYCKDCLALKAGGEKKEERSPALAAILSFIIAGLGQIYNGQIGKGILIFFTSWLIIPWVIGIVDAYKIAVKINQGKILVKSRPGCLIAAVIGVVVFGIGIFMVALLAAIAIPNLLRARLAANENFARIKVETIATAIKDYRLANNGKYPKDESDLINAKPSYLPEAYNNKLAQGYIILETFQPNGYKIVAAPKECGITGTKIFIAETGGVVSSEDCEGK